MAVSIGALAAGVFAAGLAAAQEPTPVDFDADVLPILSDHCFHCHGPDAGTREADLRLDVHDEALFVLEPGSRDDSELFARITDGRPKVVMPPPSFGKPLTADEIEVLGRWIDEGVAWESHWAFASPTGHPAPPVNDAAWRTGTIDPFVFAELQAAGLTPAAAIDAGAWLRRATLAITGLPPTIDALSAFEASGGASEAREKVVDRLLASTERAEHRTREWLDLARYADTNGYQNDFRRDQWPWRDWVLRSFARNQPYDAFIEQQVAGDLLPGASSDQILGTGFQRNHRTVTEAGSLDEEWRVENVADRVETNATAFLGLTLACARCHDHKFDPLSQRDYYRFYAFFDSIDEKGVYQETRGNVAPILRVPTAEQQTRLDELADEIAAAVVEIAAADATLGERHEAWRTADGASQAEPLPGELLLYRGDGGGGGEPGTALTGDANDAIDLGRAAAFDGTRPFTVSLWLRPETHGAVYSRMDDDDRYRGTDLVLLDGLRPAVHLIHDWDSNAIKVVGTRPLERARWHHIAVAYDGSAKAAGVTLFVNGEPVETTVEVDALDGTIESSEPLRVGIRRYAGALRGRVADVRVHAERLGQAAVLAVARERSIERTGAAFYASCFDAEARAARTTLVALLAEQSRIERTEVPTAMVLRERDEPRRTRLLSRGRYDHPIGEALTPGIPEVFGALKPSEGERASRLDLARWMVSRENPLTARVVVDRVWRSFFGRGLVDTPEDFGVRGARPAHAALLDTLADEFMRSGWDLAALERKVALSAAFAQSSAPVGDDALRSSLFGRGPRHRLDAEVVRDQALRAAGLLEQALGGPSVKPYQPDGLWAELAGGAGQGAYVPSNGADLFRRSLYTYRKRTVPHPTLTTFDAPGFELCTARRSRTNTPLQSLALMNDVTYVEAARHLATRMMAAGKDAAARIDFGMRAVLSRSAAPEESSVLQAAVARYAERFAADPSGVSELLGVGATAPDEPERTAEWAAYTLVASTILNLDEAVTQR